MSEAIGGTPTPSYQISFYGDNNQNYLVSQVDPHTGQTTPIQQGVIEDPRDIDQLMSRASDGVLSTAQGPLPPELQKYQNMQVVPFHLQNQSQQFANIPNQNMIYPGQNLYLPNQRNPVSPYFYTVQPGDNLTSITNRYNQTMQGMNGLWSPVSWQSVWQGTSNLGQMGVQFAGPQTTNPYNPFMPLGTSMLQGNFDMGQINQIAQYGNPGMQGINGSQVFGYAGSIFSAETANLVAGGFVPPAPAPASLRNPEYINSVIQQLDTKLSQVQTQQERTAIEYLREAYTEANTAAQSGDGAQMAKVAAKIFHAQMNYFMQARSANPMGNIDVIAAAIAGKFASGETEEFLGVSRDEIYNSNVNIDAEGQVDLMNQSANNPVAMSALVANFQGMFQPIQAGNPQASTISSGGTIQDVHDYRYVTTGGASGPHSQGAMTDIFNFEVQLQTRVDQHLPNTPGAVSAFLLGASDPLTGGFDPITRQAHSEGALAELRRMMGPTSNESPAKELLTAYENYGRSFSQGPAEQQQAAQQLFDAKIEYLSQGIQKSITEIDRLKSTFSDPPTQEQMQALNTEMQHLNELRNTFQDIKLTDLKPPVEGTNYSNYSANNYLGVATTGNAEFSQDVQNRLAQVDNLFRQAEGKAYAAAGRVSPESYSAEKIETTRMTIDQFGSFMAGQGGYDVFERTIEGDDPGMQAYREYAAAVDHYMDIQDTAPDAELGEALEDIFKKKEAYFNALKEGNPENAETYQTLIEQNRHEFFESGNYMGVDTSIIPFERMRELQAESTRTTIPSTISLSELAGTNPTATEARISAIFGTRGSEPSAFDFTGIQGFNPPAPGSAEEAYKNAVAAFETEPSAEAAQALHDARTNLIEQLKERAASDTTLSEETKTAFNRSLDAALNAENERWPFTSTGELKPGASPSYYGVDITDVGVSIREQANPPLDPTALREIFNTPNSDDIINAALALGVGSAIPAVLREFEGDRGPLGDLIRAAKSGNAEGVETAKSDFVRAGLVFLNDEVTNTEVTALERNSAVQNRSLLERLADEHDIDVAETIADEELYSPSHVTDVLEASPDNYDQIWTAPPADPYERAVYESLKTIAEGDTEGISRETLIQQVQEAKQQFAQSAINHHLERPDDEAARTAINGILTAAEASNIEGLNGVQAVTLDPPRSFGNTPTLLNRDDLASLMVDLNVNNFHEANRNGALANNPSQHVRELYNNFEALETAQAEAGLALEEFQEQSQKLYELENQNPPASARTIERTRDAAAQARERLNTANEAVGTSLEQIHNTRVSILEEQRELVQNAPSGQLTTAQKDNILSQLDQAVDAENERWDAFQNGGRTIGSVQFDATQDRESIDRQAREEQEDRDGSNQGLFGWVTDKADDLGHAAGDWLGNATLDVAGTIGGDSVGRPTEYYVMDGATYGGVERRNDSLYMGQENVQGNRRDMFEGTNYDQEYFVAVPGAGLTNENGNIGSDTGDDISFGFRSAFTDGVRGAANPSATSFGISMIPGVGQMWTTGKFAYDVVSSYTRRNETDNQDSGGTFSSHRLFSVPTDPNQDRNPMDDGFTVTSSESEVYGRISQTFTYSATLQRTVDQRSEELGRQEHLENTSDTPLDDVDDDTDYSGANGWSDPEPADSHDRDR